MHPLLYAPFKGFLVIIKPKLEGLPATYTETPDEAMTLTVYLEDEVTGVCLELLYTIFELGALARSARIINRGKSEVHLLSAMSLCLDGPGPHFQKVGIILPLAYPFPKIQLAQIPVGQNSHNVAD